MDPYDILERGYGRYRWHREYIRVPEHNKMQFTQIHKVNGKRTQYIMFSEDEPEMKLYANFVKGQWLIYQLDSKDPQFDEKDYLFKQIVNPSFSTLWSSDCESCQLQYKILCTSNETSRQQLMITQVNSRSFGESAINLLRGYIPRITIGNTRSIWCSAKANKQQDTYKEIKLKSIDDKEFDPQSMFLHSKIPQWDSMTKSWQIDCHGRIQRSSKRNIQLIKDFGFTDPITFQMGKVAKGIYVVDYRQPMCFIQAMGIALQTNQFKSVI